MPYDDVEHLRGCCGNCSVSLRDEAAQLELWVVMLGSATGLGTLRSDPDAGVGGRRPEHDHRSVFLLTSAASICGDI